MLNLGNKSDDKYQTQISLSEERSPKEIKETLHSGRIPSKLRDELRIVPLDSAAGQKFQKAMEPIAHKLRKHFDIEESPIRFFLMDLPGINACQIREAQPPLIGFTKGCFITTESEGFQKETYQPLETIDEVALILAHEQVHLNIEKSINPKHNTKLEEAIANYRPIDAVYHAGFNPAAGQSRIRDAMASQNGKIDWGHITDVHPIPSSSLSITEAALTQLNRKYGDITRESTPIEEHHQLIEAANEAAHISTLEQLLTERAYDSSSIENKAEIIEEIIRRDTHLDGRRFQDLKKVVNDYRKSLRAETDKDKLLAPIFDATLDLIETRSNPDPNIETLLSYIAPQNLGIKPLGRLKPLELACRNFIKSASYEDARTSAIALLKAIEEEPLSSQSSGRALLKSISFSQFRFPDIDKVNTRPQKLSWNRHMMFAERELKDADAPIVEALISLGVHEPRLYANMKDKTAVNFFIGRSSAVFRGPHDGSTGINSLSFADDTAISVALLHERPSHNADSLKLFYRVKHAENLFIRCIQEREPASTQEEDLYRLSNQIDKLKHHEHDLPVSELLIGLSHIEKAPELFIKINSERLDSRLAQREVVKHIFNAECLPSIRRKIGLALSSSELNLARSYQDELLSSDGAPLDPSAAYERNLKPITSSPLLSQMLAPSNSTLSDEEKQILARNTISWESFLDSPLGSYDANTLTTLPSPLCNDYKRLLEELSIVFPTERERILNIGTWEDLDNCVQELGLANNPLGKEIVLIHSLLIGSNTNNPESLESAILERTLDILVHPASYSEYSQRDVSPVALKIIRNQMSFPPLWSDDYKQACKEWKTFYQAEIMPHEEQDKYLHDLLDRVDSLAEPETRREAYELLLNTRGKGLKSYKRIKDPELRSRLANSWAKSILESYGHDDDTEGYRVSIIQAVEAVEPIIARADRSEFLNILSKTVTAQESLSLKLGERTESLSETTLLNSNLPFMGIEGFQQILTKDFESRSEVLRYLTAPISSNTLAPVVERALDWERNENTDPDELRKQISAQFKDIHKNFWALPLEARALIMKEILTPHQASPAEIDDAFEMTLEIVFPKDKSHSANARRWVRAYIDATPQHAQHLLLSALLVAGQKSEDAQGDTGFAIASFLESMGPAETKAGQAAQGHPQTPEDIRRDLTRLKTRADEPSRWELFSLINQSLEPEVRETISHVGRVLGSASLYVAVEITTTNGESAVLSILRPSGRERAQFGFTLLDGMISKLDQESSSFQVMRDIISDSKELIENETNTSLAPHQRDTARGLYNTSRVFIDGEEIRFYVPPIVKTGEHYVVSEKAPGPHFIDLPPGEERKKFAKAILALELNAILSGLPFDNDRHGGNCRIQDNIVYHFDFGGMMLSSPSEKELNELSKVILSSASGSVSIEEFVQRYFSTLRSMNEKGEILSPLLKRAQKALLSLAEYSQDMTEDDLKDITYAALDSAHPVVKSAAKDAFRNLPLKGKLALLNPFNRRNPNIRIERG